MPWRYPSSPAANPGDHESYYVRPFLLAQYHFWYQNFHPVSLHLENQISYS